MENLWIATQVKTYSFSNKNNPKGQNFNTNVRASSI